MVDPAVRDLLAAQDSADRDAVLVVQFSALPEKRILAAPSAAARIEILTSHVKERIGELTRDSRLAPDAIEVMGALGQAVIHAPASTLARMVAPTSALATATDCEVKPNVLMPGLPQM